MPLTKRKRNTSEPRDEEEQEIQETFTQILLDASDTLSESRLVVQSFYAYFTDVLLTWGTTGPEHYLPIRYKTFGLFQALLSIIRQLQAS